MEVVNAWVFEPVWDLLRHEPATSIEQPAAVAGTDDVASNTGGGFRGPWVGALVERVGQAAVGSARSRASTSGEELRSGWSSQLESSGCAG